MFNKNKERLKKLEFQLRDYNVEKHDVHCNLDKALRQITLIAEHLGIEFTETETILGKMTIKKKGK